MTLTKAVKELMEELQRPDLTEEEKKALNKYQHWLFGIKKTVSNNTESLHQYPQVRPCFGGFSYCDGRCANCTIHYSDHTEANP